MKTDIYRCPSCNQEAKIPRVNDGWYEWKTLFCAKCTMKMERVINKLTVSSVSSKQALYNRVEYTKIGESGTVK
jgi:transcription elongation factor Elf1